jgi:endonuclease/exonuclease/phosphatase family metal-dependent hydrolase
MKRKLLIGLFVSVLAGEGYLAYQTTQETIDFIPNIDQISVDSVLVPRADRSNIYVCSFNIQFLGNSKKRDNLSLARLLSNFDIVVIQELLAPPFEGKFPSSGDYRPKPQSEAFFKAMISEGFKYVLSEEDTGPGPNNHLNSSATEWWVIFYNNRKVRVANDLPHGYLASDRSNNPDYDRVPYAFPFRSLIDSTDFVLVSVHLSQEKSAKQRRMHELSEITYWIDKNDTAEKDFIILGDMNIQNKTELEYVIPNQFISLNNECVKTNTSIKEAKPYDHIMFRPQYTSNEIDTAFGMVVINLVSMMEPSWNSNSNYPGNPYNHDQFRQYYSDHHPIVFRMKVSRDDD